MPLDPFTAAPYGPKNAPFFDRNYLAVFAGKPFDCMTRCAMFFVANANIGLLASELHKRMKFWGKTIKKSQFYSPFWGMNLRDPHVSHDPG